MLVLLEERGFESVWAPEHSHIPLTRKSPFPGGGELPVYAVANVGLDLIQRRAAFVVSVFRHHLRSRDPLTQPLRIPQRQIALPVGGGE